MSRPLRKLRFRRGPIFFKMLGGNKFRLRNSPPRCGSEFTAHPRRPACGGAPRAAAQAPWQKEDPRLTAGIFGKLGELLVDLDDDAGTHGAAVPTKAPLPQGPNIL